MNAAVLGVERSLTGRRWRDRNVDDRLAQALSQRHNLPEVVGRVLAGRGVGLDDAERFLKPTLRDWLPDPSIFRDMDVAAERLARAIRNNERVAVFGDYDVDGATSSALLRRFFRAVGRDLVVYIPDRQREGYGPNAPALRKLAADGIAVVITVDCGTLAHEPLAAARDAGLEVIVVDHHLAEPALPAAFAIINPNRLDEAPGHGQLAAVGVAFLLVVALNRILRQSGWYETRPEPDLRDWLDIVAIGTVADVVPLTGVNRALVTQGLKVLARRGNVGLAALADVAGLDQPPGAYHAGFIFGPRINAGGRVGQSDLGTRLLNTDDPAEAQRLARELNQLNRERQEIEKAVLEEAMGQLGAYPADVPVVVLAAEGWHPGVIGIVAARVREAANRPTLIIAVDDTGIGKGSGRSVPGVDLGGAVVAARQSGLLINGGGHVMAAGVTVARDTIPALRDFLAHRLGPAMAAATDLSSLGVDGALGVTGATPQLMDLLEQAGPYGAGNAEPRFAMPSCRVVNASVVGERHVRCVITNGAGQGRLKAIAFRSLETPLGPALLNSGGSLHLAGHLRTEWFRGERRVQLIVEDAAPARDAV